MPVGEWAPQADEAGTALRVLAWRAAFADGAAPGGFAAVAGGLRVAPSRLPGAGDGLFAARRGAARDSWAWRARDGVCVYEGSALATKSALRVEDKSYLMRLGPQARARAPTPARRFASVRARLSLCPSPRCDGRAVSAQQHQRARP